MLIIFKAATSIAICENLPSPMDPMMSVAVPVIKWLMELAFNMQIFFLKKEIKMHLTLVRIK